MSRLSRRRFLQRTLAAAATVTIAGTKSSGQVLGANDTIRLGVAGLHDRGGAHVKAFAGRKGVQVTYLIDPDTRQFDRRVKEVKEKGHNTPKTVQDIRQALDDKELDAVSVATPNHWHSLITVWACQAGKDVYVEKPCSHNVHEGRVAVEAARKHNRIVQHGTQRRSSPDWARAVAVIKSGQLGRLLVARGICYKYRGSIGVKPPAPPPAELDFDIWLGPAPRQPYHANLVHYNWHWFWDFGNGDIGNQGIHELDVARWAMKGATLPGKVWSLGGRFADGDQGQTPNMQMAVFEYGDVLLIFEVRGLVDKPADSSFKFKVANEYYTTEGMIANGKFHPKNGGPPQDLDRFDVKVAPGGPWGSFLNAVRSRNVSDCNADVELGHHSCTLIHAANASYRLGEEVSFDAKSKKLGDNHEVVETFENITRNLQGVGVMLEGASYQLGRTLTLDAQTERFTDDGAQQANAFLTRNYRAPFVVPERV